MSLRHSATAEQGRMEVEITGSDLVTDLDTGGDGATVGGAPVRITAGLNDAGYHAMVADCTGNGREIRYEQDRT